MIPMIFAKKENLIDNSPISIVSDTLAIKCMLPIKTTFNGENLRITESTAKNPNISDIQEPMTTAILA